MVEEWSLCKPNRSEMGILGSIIGQWVSNGGNLHRPGTFVMFGDIADCHS